MRIQTFSIVAGSEACNARCPYCISKMTPPANITLKEPEVNWRNFGVACRFARPSGGGTKTALITGKGEPTLFPEQITKFLARLSKFDFFPLKELQTNGICLADQLEDFSTYLDDWYKYGLTTIAISVAHYLPEKNKEIFLPYRKSYIDLSRLIWELHQKGFSVRLSCVMAREYVDSVSELAKFIKFAKDNKVEQSTIRPINAPENSMDQEVKKWSQEHFLRDNELAQISYFLNREGHLLMTLAHGAKVYDVGGQNICLTDSLTINPSSDDIRQLIFFPDGHLRYDWRYEGAILL